MTIHAQNNEKSMKNQFALRGVLRQSLFDSTQPAVIFRDGLLVDSSHTAPENGSDILSSQAAIRGRTARTYSANCFRWKGTGAYIRRRLKPDNFQPTQVFLVFEPVWPACHVIITNAQLLGHARSLSAWHSRSRSVLIWRTQGQAAEGTPRGLEPNTNSASTVSTKLNYTILLTNKSRHFRLRRWSV